MLEVAFQIFYCDAGNRILIVTNIILFLITVTMNIGHDPISTLSVPVLLLLKWINLNSSIKQKQIFKSNFKIKQDRDDSNNCLIEYILTSERTNLKELKRRIDWFFMYSLFLLSKIIAIIRPPHYDPILT